MIRAADHLTPAHHGRSLAAKPPYGAGHVADGRPPRGRAER